MSATAREILVTGAAGFIGRALVPLLVQRGWRVRAFIHVEEPAFVFRESEVTIVRGDVRDAATLENAVRGVQAVVSLAARKMDEPDSFATNVGGARNLIAACRAAGVSRLVNISSQSAKLARPGVYGRTKREADALFASSGLDVTTLRPSLVYGPGPSGAFDTVRRFVARLPVVPILGDGRWISAPVQVSDVATAIADVLEQPPTIGRTYDLGGPDLISFDALVDRVSAGLGRRVRKLHVPLWLALAAAGMLRRVWPGAPISVSNVLGSNQDTGLDLEPAQRELGFVPRSLAVGLRELFDVAAEQALRHEARRLGQYLLGDVPPDELCARYVAAVRRRLGGREDQSVRLFRRLPWTLPVLDAALAVFGRDRQLRQRVLLMAAVLEASPRYAGRLLAPPCGRARLIGGLVGRTITSAAALACGVILLPFVLGRDVRVR